MVELYVDPDLPDCCYPCTACGRTVCMDEEPSPAEGERICAVCFDMDWEPGA